MIDLLKGRCVGLIEAFIITNPAESHRRPGHSTEEQFHLQRLVKKSGINLVLQLLIAGEHLHHCPTIKALARWGQR